MMNPRLKRGLFLLVTGIVLWLVPALVLALKAGPGMSDAELREVWGGMWVGYKLSVVAGIFSVLYGLYTISRRRD
jgi:hypothetical protein